MAGELVTSQIWASYSSGVGFLLHAIYAFSSDQQRLMLESPMGISLAIASFALILTGAAGSYEKNPLCRTFRLSLASVWIAESMYFISHAYAPSYFEVDIPQKHALLPGYFGIIITMVILCLLAIASRFKEVLFQCSIYLLAVIFEVSAIWKDMQPSVGACYVVLCSITSCLVLQDTWNALYETKPTKQSRSLTTTKFHDSGNDYVIVCQALNVVSAAAYASQAFWENTHQKFAFMWFGGSALVQLFCSVVLARKGNGMYAGLVGLCGSVWLNTSYYLSLQLFTGLNSLPIIAIQICLILLFLVVSVAFMTQNLFFTIQGFAFMLLSAVRCSGSELSMIIVSWIILAISSYGMIAIGLKSIQFRIPFPMGLSIYIPLISKISLKKISEKFNAQSSLSRMGYTKYSDYSSVGFLSNSLAALAVTWSPVNWNLLVLPWTFGIGGLLQLAVGSISFSRGYTFESCSHFLFAAFWSIWGTLRALGIDKDGVSESIGCVSFLLICIVMIALATSISKTWVIHWALFALVIISHILYVLNANGHGIYSSVVSIAFALISLYCFVASFMSLAPTGQPILEVSYLHSRHKKIAWASASRSSGINTIAEILNNGGIVGLPSDTVYILVAACKNPAAVKRLYETKKQAAQRPISLWISDLNQISAGRQGDFSTLLWDFMCAVWPSSISLVIKRGNWVSSLGMGESAQYVGRPDSIAVRMPDTTVLNHLIEMTGPIAVTSANPSGEADTTHHLQVLAKLGEQNCDGILCDGSSAENIASTVVDCKNIDESQLGFFRVGLVPKSRVTEIFHGILKRQKACDDGADLASTDSGVEGLNDVDRFSTVDTRKSFVSCTSSNTGCGSGELNHAFVNDNVDLIVHKPMDASIGNKHVLSTNSIGSYGSLESRLERATRNTWKDNVLPGVTRDSSINSSYEIQTSSDDFNTKM